MPTAEKMLNQEKLYNNGKFVKYNTIKDKKFIYTFIKEDCYSNSSNLEAQSTDLWLMKILFPEVKTTVFIYR